MSFSPISPVTAPTLNANWIAFGSGFTAPGYWKDPGGAVYLRGLLGVTATFGPASVIFQLPVGFRPVGKEVWLTYYLSTARGGALIQVDSSGNVTFSGTTLGANVVSGDAVGLSGIEFLVNI